MPVFIQLDTCCGPTLHAPRPPRPAALCLKTPTETAPWCSSSHERSVRLEHLRPFTLLCDTPVVCRRRWSCTAAWCASCCRRRPSHTTSSTPATSPASSRAPCAPPSPSTTPRTPCSPSGCAPGLSPASAIPRSAAQQAGLPRRAIVHRHAGLAAGGGPPASCMPPWPQHAQQESWAALCCM